MKNVLFNILSKLCLIQFKLSELRFKEKIIKNFTEMSLFVLKFVKHIMIAGVHVKLNVQLLSKHFQLNSYKVSNLNLTFWEDINLIISIFQEISFIAQIFVPLKSAVLDVFSNVSPLVFKSW